MNRSFNQRQQGFTLLELLVVITLLAVLAVGALVAYEDVGENAQAAAGANVSGTIDKAIRTYRSVQGVYPNQWDSLSTQTGEPAGGTANTFLAPVTRTFIGNLTLPGSSAAAIESSLIAAGIEEIQYANTRATTIAPNRAHNESANPTTGPGTGAVEVELEDAGIQMTNISVIPTGACTSGEFAGLMTAAFDGTLAASGVSPNYLQNRYVDALEGDECHLLVALGFGGDAAGSTVESRVAIGSSPTFTKTTNDPATTINPATHYARYIGLFHVGEADNAGTAIGEIRTKAHLVAVIAPDGSNLDQLVSDAQLQ